MAVVIANGLSFILPFIGIIILPSAWDNAMSEEFFVDGGHDDYSYGARVTCFSFAIVCAGLSVFLIVSMFTCFKDDGITYQQIQPAPVTYMAVPPQATPVAVQTTPYQTAPYSAAPTNTVQTNYQTTPPGSAVVYSAV